LVILGVSAFFHDAAAALLVDGRVVAAAQEERFSRRKHDPALPAAAARFCLEQAGLHIDDVDHVVFYEKPLKKFERILLTHLRSFPRSLGQFPRSLSSWLGRRLWTKAELCEALGCAPERLLFCEHHLSHAASAFFASPFARAAVVTIDGVGESATTSIFRAHDGALEADGRARVELVEELAFPDSMGLVYSALTAYLGFRVNEGEYKVMGLAGYGRPRFAEVLAEIIGLDEETATLAVDPRYFCYERHATRSFTAALEQLLGPARLPGTPLRLGVAGAEADRFADVAASIQVLTERYVLALARRARRVTGERALCLAGGVALNCVANHRLEREGPFEAIFVQPAAGDAGGALGAAEWCSHVLHGEPRAPAMRHAFLGQGYDTDEVARFLDQAGVAFVRHDDDDALDAAVAERLARGEVGGWFQGRFEWGPRALGARSILADPRGPLTQARVNERIKRREPFRPFAPAVLDDEAGRWFEMPPGPDLLTPFMCSVVPVRAEARAQLPAVTHVDGTARVQRVDQGGNPRLHALLRAFRARTGVGVLLNTSMNLKDEPMCASPAEAYAMFCRSELDFLAIERCLVDRRPA
jgi:carbamoyltransferase